MEILITVNIIAALYVFITMKVGLNRKEKMTDGAYHHLISHMLLVAFIIIAIDLYVVRGYTLPFILMLVYLAQHVTKENLRLLDTNRWTPTIHDEFEPTTSI